MGVDTFDAIPPLCEPVGTGFTGISGSKAEIPGYSLADPAVQCSATTRAMCLDLNKSEQHHQYLDEFALLQTLKTIDSTLATPSADKRHFFLITSQGDPSAEWDSLEISHESLKNLYHTLRFSKDYNTFYTARLFHCSYHFHYDVDADLRDPPVSIIIIIRFPRNSRCISCIMRVQLADHSCVAFLCGPDDKDLNDMRSLCIEKSELLKVHPLYLLTLISDQRYPYLASSFAGLWLELVLAETATRMTRPDWMTTVLKRELPGRLEALSNTDVLLYQLHATNTELCQCDTAMSFAAKYGDFCLDVLDVVERFRERRGHTPLPDRYRSDLEGKIRFYVENCDEIRKKLSEVKDRIRGQINVSFSLIAQKDAKINLEDSRSVRTISIMTMAFLPLTLVTSIWTANLFQLDDAINWKVYVGTTVFLTIAVFFTWWLYMHISRRRKVNSPLLVEGLELDLFDVGSVQNHNI